MTKLYTEEEVRTKSEVAVRTAYERGYVNGKCDALHYARQHRADEAADILRSLLASLTPSESLPVIATCGECGWWEEGRVRSVCGHPDLRDRAEPVLLVTKPDDTPPALCPLRPKATP